MTNQFRNDGEMPPEIAAQFPVVDRRVPDQEDATSGAKNKTMGSSSRTTESIEISPGIVAFNVLTALILLVMWELADRSGVSLLIGFMTVALIWRFLFYF